MNDWDTPWGTFNTGVRGCMPRQPAPLRRRLQPNLAKQALQSSSREDAYSPGWPNRLVLIIIQRGRLQPNLAEKACSHHHPERTPTAQLGQTGLFSSSSREDAYSPTWPNRPVLIIIQRGRLQPRLAKQACSHHLPQAEAVQWRNSQGI